MERSPKRTYFTTYTQWLPDGDPRIPISGKVVVRQQELRLITREGNACIIYSKHKRRAGWLMQILRAAKGRCSDTLNPVFVDENAVVGVDLGLNPVIALSTGEKFYTPACIFKSLKRIDRLRRQLAKKVHGSQHWKLTKLRLQKAKRRLSRQVHQFLSAPLKIVAQYRVVVLESCDVDYWLARLFVKRLKKLRLEQLSWVTAHNNSFTCAHCGSRTVKAIRKKRLRCPQCDKTLDRDINAAVVGKQRLVARQLG